MEKKVGIGLLISLITVGIILGFLFIPKLLKSEDIDPTISLFFHTPTPTSAQPTPPQSNHPVDILTSISGLENINWILTDTIGSGKYRVWVNDTNNNYYVWQDWSDWVNNVNLQVPINRSIAGLFNYTIEYNNSNGLFGIPDSVIVTIITLPPPTSNHPADIMTSTIGTDTINWIIWDEVGSGKYRVWANDTNNNYYVWQDWTDWVNNTNLQVPIENNFTGIFNYTIEYNNSIGLLGDPDSVIVTIVSAGLPTSNHPVDITVAITGWETIDWILWDAVGSGKYRVWADDTNNNYYVWQDWTGWVNNINLKVPINRSIVGIFNYTIEYNNSNGAFGIPDMVIVNITFNNINTVAKFQNCSANITYSLAVASGNVTLDGATITGEYINSTECNNVTSSFYEWTNFITIYLYNDAKLNITSLDRDLGVYVRGSASVKINSLTTQYSLRINLWETASIEMNKVISNNTLKNIGVVAWDYSSGIITNSSIDYLTVLGSSSISVLSSNLTDVSSIDKSNLTLINCNVTGILTNGIYVSSGTLTVNAGSLLGSYENTTSLINTNVNAKILFISGYGTSIINLQSFTEELGINIYQNAVLSASGAIMNDTLVWAYGYTTVIISGINNSLFVVNGVDYSNITIVNSTLKHCGCLHYSNATIQNSNLINIQSFHDSKISIKSNSNVTNANAYGSLMTIESSNAINLDYGVYYTAGNITINNGILPGGYFNCCNIINSPQPNMNLKAIVFKGSTFVTISGTTPDWSFSAGDDVIMNVQAVNTSGGFSYYQNSSGQIQNSNVSSIYLYLSLRKYFSVTIDNTRTNSLYAYGFNYIVLIKNDSSIENSNIYFI